MESQIYVFINLSPSSFAFSRTNSSLHFFLISFKISISFYFQFETSVLAASISVHHIYLRYYSFLMCNDDDVLVEFYAPTSQELEPISSRSEHHIFFSLCSFAILILTE